MVVGVGVDLIEVARIRAALEDPRLGRRFRERVYTEREIAYCEGRARKFESYAARFAAKEAVMKALRTGWGARAAWREIEVDRTRNGAPRIVLHRNASACAREMGIARLSLSLSHTAEHAIALVIAEGDAPTL